MTKTARAMMADLRMDLIMDRNSDKKELTRFPNGRLIGK